MTVLRRCCENSLEWKGPTTPTRGTQTECRWCDETLVYDGTAWQALNVRSARTIAELTEQRLKRYVEILGRPLADDFKQIAQIQTCESCGGLATVIDWSPSTATYVCADGHVSFLPLPSPCPTS